MQKRTLLSLTALVLSLFSLPIIHSQEDPHLCSPEDSLSPLKSKYDLGWLPPENDENFFFTLEQHWEMINDHARNEAYRKAIEELITPDSIVMDLGAGTGLLSLFAAKAGAKVVWAVERHPETVKIAEQILDANDPAHRVRLIAAKSQQIVYDPLCPREEEGSEEGEGSEKAQKLLPRRYPYYCIPEKITHLISETLATDIHGESWLFYLNDLKARGVLEDDVTIIPSGSKVIAQVFWSGMGLPRNSKIGDFDFSPLGKWRTMTRDEAELCGIIRDNITEPIVVEEFSYTDEEPIRLPFAFPSKIVTTTVTSPGNMNTIGVWWEAQLSPHVTLSTSPCILSVWRQTVFVLATDVYVNEGDSIDLQFVHNGHMSHTMAQPTSLREREAHLFIQNFSPNEYMLYWVGPSSMPVETIGPYQNDDAPRHVIKTTPGHRFLLIGNGEEGLSHSVTISGIVDSVYIEQDGAFYHSHREEEYF